MKDPSQTARLLDLVRDGDEHARNDLIAYVSERLRALTRRMLRHFPLVRNNEQTDDVLQNAMMRLHRSLEQLRPESPLHFYNLATQQIRRSLIDMARHYMKQGAVRHFSESGGDAVLPADAWADVRNEPSDLESWTAFHEAVEKLPDLEREVFDIRWYDGLTLDKAAELLAVSSRTVKRRWQSAAPVACLAAVSRGGTMMPNDPSHCPHCQRGPDLGPGRKGLRCPICNYQWAWVPRDAADVAADVAAHVAKQMAEADGKGPFSIGDVEVSEETFRRYWGLLPLLPPSTAPSSSPPFSPFVVVRDSVSDTLFDTVDRSPLEADVELLAELLMQWEDAQDAGQEISAQVLCSECPHLVGPLLEHIADLESLRWLKESDSQDPGPEAGDWKSVWKRGDEPTAGYKLVRLLGHGSFGEVWSAQGPDGTPHAIKIVDHPSKSLQEQRGLRRIVDVRHQFVLLIELIRLENEKLIIVTELAECSLHDVFARRRRMLSAVQENRRHADALFDTIHHEILRLLRDAAEALDYMREVFHLMHLDVKPTNLMIINGRCKVGDFGTISRLVSPFDTPGLLPIPTEPAAFTPPPAVAQPAGVIGARITNSGAFTHKYAPPEAYRGEFSSTHDQYSLAMTYCELLTGKVPFTGEWDEQVRQRSTHRMNVDILPPQVRLVVTQALASNPAERYSSCVEFIESLYRALGGGTIDTSLDEMLGSRRGPSDPTSVGRQTIECRVPADVSPEQSAPTQQSRGSLSVLFPGDSESFFQAPQTHPLSLEEGRWLVVGRQEGGGTEYLHPHFEPTQRLPGSQRRIVVDLAQGDDSLVSRGHFTLRGSVDGIVFINGVPHRNGAIRPPRNGTFLLDPHERPLLSGEEILIAHGTSIKIRLPNKVKVLICADALEQD